MGNGNGGQEGRSLPVSMRLEILAMDSILGAPAARAEAGALVGLRWWWWWWEV